MSLQKGMQKAGEIFSFHSIASLAHFIEIEDTLQLSLENFCANKTDLPFACYLNY